MPDKGRGSDKPVNVPGLGVNAQALRFLDLLASNIITIEQDGLIVIRDFSSEVLLVATISL